MRVISTTKNLEMSEALATYIEKKFLMLKKYINVLKKEGEVGKTLAQVFVEVEKETRHHNKGCVFLVKSRVALPGRTLIAEAEEEDLYKAVVKAKDEMKLEIEKYKTKKVDINRRKARKLSETVEI